MGKRKQDVQLLVVARRIDSIIFFGFAAAIVGVLALLGYAIMANIV